VATLSYGNWPELREDIDGLRDERSDWRKWIEQAAEILAQAFGTDASFGPGVVERIYQGESVRAGTVRRIMPKFLEAVGL
jgi:hypothetical protein